MKTIPIVYATDLNYARYMLVSMYSVMKNVRNDYDCRFIVLVSQSEDVDQMDFVKEKLSVFSNCTVEFVKIEDSFSNASLQVERLTSATFYRLLLPDLFSEMDKCLYLDGDTVVVGDIAELWNEDIGDNMIGGVEGHNFTSREKKHRKRLEWDENLAFRYVNAGVLIFNLKEMRKHKVTEKFKTLIDRDFKYADQDLINIACADSIQYLPCRYNIRPYYTGWYAEITDNNKMQQELEKAMDDPVVYHYASMSKPWGDIETVFGDAWLKYALVDDLKGLFDDARQLQNDPEKVALISEARRRMIAENRVLSEKRQLKRELAKARTTIRRQEETINKQKDEIKALRTRLSVSEKGFFYTLAKKAYRKIKSS